MLGVLRGANMLGMWYITCYLTCHTHTHNMPYMLWLQNVFGLHTLVLGRQGKKECTSSFVLLALKTIFHPSLPCTCHVPWAKQFITL